MSSEHHEEDWNVNIVIWSEISMGDDKGKQPKDNAWVCKSLAKEAEFDLEHVRETFMEAKKSFDEASTSRSKAKYD